MENNWIARRKNKSKEYFVDELVEISRQVAELKALENRRIQAERALDGIKERALFLSRAIDNSEQPVFAAYADGKIITCNRTFLNLTGYTKEELNKITWTGGLTPPEQRSKVALVLDEVRRTKQPQHYRQEYIRKDGMLVEVELVTNQACDLSGRFRYFYSIIKDSKLKPVKNKLLVYQRQVAELIEFLPNAAAVVGRDRTVLAWNRAMEKTTGISKEQIIGSSYNDYARPFYRDNVPALTELILNGDDADPGQGQIATAGHTLMTDLFIPTLPGGKEMFFRVMATPLHDDSGELIGVVESICSLNGQQQEEDRVRKSHEEIKELFSEHINKLIAANQQLQQELAERSQDEQSLRRAEQERELFLGSISERIVFYDVNMRVLWANRAAGEAFGQAPEQLVGAHHHDLWRCSGLDCPLERALETARPQEGKTILDGRVWVVRGYPVQDSSGRIGVVEVAYEIAGEASIQKNLKLARDFEQEMTRLDRLSLVGEMAAGIGHEIRNPMTTVRGFLQFLSGKSDAHKYKEYYDLMIEELDRANAVITEFLSLAKNRALNLTVKNLNLIVRAVYPMLKADATMNEKYIKLELQDVPDLLLDEKEIRQLLLNLLRNALEAMPAGGSVTVRTYASGDNVVLSIQDQGKGMDKTVLDKLGTPFFTTKDYGTGLGLAACYSIADRHGASIEVDTGPGGTTFYVKFCNKQLELPEQ